MRKKLIVAFLFLVSTILSGCTGGGSMDEDAESHLSETNTQSETGENISLTSEIRSLDDGLSAVRYDGDYQFDLFLEQGAASDGDVVSFLAENLLSGLDLGDIVGNIFGCSTLSAVNASGEHLFGRNFDWENCEAMIVETHPQNGYASISTVNMDFITQSLSGTAKAVLKLDEVKTLTAIYAPLDGMNEKGLAVSVNMIQDSADISQDKDKTDITTTTAVRLLLDQAASVEEALELLEAYDLHGSMGMMIHFALSDSTGRSVVVEYVENEMIVIETPVVTNFYLAEGEKYGIGTQQSHERYEILMNTLKEKEILEMEDMRDALDSVSKDNFEEYASTEWSIVFNLSTGEARYYHRENYRQAYSIRLK
ncbi:MAG: C45 family peptidase [Lachnospiraceae bacterium]|nr:C45 family peptidase [Lachnospiraceae bacterium]